MHTPSPSPTGRGRPNRPAWLLALALAALVGCQKEPGRFDQVQQETRRNAPAVSKQALPGSDFNKFFPKTEGDFDLVYAQEKPGFAQAKLVNKGQDVATISVFDTISNPEAAQKYKDTQDTFEGFPIIEIGNNGTGLLVADRYQVQIRSTEASFSKFDREDWLKKFDLKGLARLQ